MSATFRISANPDDGVRADEWTGYTVGDMPKHLGWVTIKVGRTEIVIDDITNEQALSLGRQLANEEKQP